MTEKQPEKTLVNRVAEVFLTSEGKPLPEQITLHLDFIELELSGLPTGSERDQAYAELREAYKEVTTQKGGDSATIYALID